MSIVQSVGRVRMGFRSSFGRAIPTLLMLLGCLAAPGAAAGADIRPSEDRFEKVALTKEIVDPMEISIARDGRVFIVERGGKVKVFKPDTKQTLLAGQIKVHTGQEDGLLGLALAPDFDKTGHAYIMYSRPHASESLQHLSRFTFSGDQLDLSSEKILLKIPTDRRACCHAGGSVAFGPGGNLFISTGDNTEPFQSDGRAPIDEIKGREFLDAQKSSSNANDLRGKVLRIHPEPDGTYTIPAGNLFAPGTPNTRPEIYVMGNRNPFRIAVDQRNGYLYWGEVGPDAGNDTPRGPRGYDEINQARKAGFFGWPYFVADNKPYADYNFAAKKLGALFNPAHPFNDSPNNTGPRDLPPAQPAFIWYPAGNSKEFPVLGSGGRTAMAGPVYYHDTLEFTSATRLPAYFHNNLIIYEWTRNWIMTVRLDSEGNLVKIEPFMPGHVFNKPMDIEMGHDGSLYVLEFGSKWGGNDNSLLSRIDFHAGNRPPVARAGVDVMAGRAPLKVAFNSTGTMDKDAGDKLTYAWRFFKGGPIASTEAAPTFTYTAPGTHTATLTVTDSNGDSASAEVAVMVGNDRPQVEIQIVEGGRFLQWDKAYRYQVKVTDAEDGSTEGGKIPADRVLVRASFQKFTEDSGKPQTPEEIGLGLMKRSDCFACHTLRDKSAGPAYSEIAKKYKNDKTIHETLAKKVLAGGVGVWGPVPMAPHPQHSIEETRQMVSWVLSLANDQSKDLIPGVSGTFKTRGRPSSGSGVYVITATYTDNGAPGVGPLTGEATLILPAQRIEAEAHAKSQGIQNLKGTDGGECIFLGATEPGDWVAFSNLNLSGVKRLACRVASPHDNGLLEVRVGSPTGPLVGDLKVPKTGGYETWTTAPLEIRQPAPAGDIYFVFKPRTPGGPQGGLMNINWFELEME